MKIIVQMLIIQTIKLNFCDYLIPLNIIKIKINNHIHHKGQKKKSLLPGKI